MVPVPQDSMRLPLHRAQFLCHHRPILLKISVSQLCLCLFKIPKADTVDSPRTYHLKLCYVTIHVAHLKNVSSSNATR